ncbi:unnamed protein product [Cyprideis torosa]|uniref:Uncharacterized protein n=1 Tax=Cyprideis torosa TaxID=163714 RepID=A0A7R8ZJX0_9CRUS|nr:unnamed protein product [Cyprideis torosa]CAG0883201.1 unnamed protein product [Cyprideis torosa]
MDGTFKTRPLLVGQLYVIHYEQLGGHVLPGAFVLMTHKTEDMYRSVFNALKDAMPAARNSGPDTYSIDFELAVTTAFENVFPDARLRFCYFHFTQSMWRKAQDSGVAARYMRTPEQELRAQFHAILAIAFVPVADVRTALTKLRSACVEDLDDVLDLLEDYYILGRRRGRGRGAVRFPPNTWNVYEATATGVPRTNNSAEAWNRRWTVLISKTHPNIFEFIEALKQEEMYVEHQRNVVELGQEPPKKKKKYRENDDRLRRLVERYAQIIADDNLLLRSLLLLLLLTVAPYDSMESRHPIPHLPPSANKDQSHKHCKDESDSKFGINCMLLHDDGSVLATGGEDGRAVLWATNGGNNMEQMSVLEGHEALITCMAFWDSFLYTGSEDSTIRKWNLASNECEIVYRGHSGRINKLLCTAQTLFSTSSDTTTKAWSLEADDNMSAETDLCIRTFKGHQTGVFSVLYILEDENKPRTQREIEREIQAGNIDVLYDMSHGDILITGSFDGTARSFNFTSGKRLKVFRGHSNAITAMATDTDVRILLTGSMDHTIRAWNIHTAKCLKVYTGHSGPVLCLTPGNGAAFFSGSSDRTAKSWALAHADCLQTYRDHEHSITSIRAEEGIVFTSCGDGHVRAFDGKSGQLLRKYRGHTACVVNLIIWENELYTGSQDGTVKLWSAF